MGTRREYTRVRPGAARTEYRLSQARYCLEALVAARTRAQQAGLGFTLPRINRAIASARGAVRNAESRVTREARRA